MEYLIIVGVVVLIIIFVFKSLISKKKKNEDKPISVQKQKSGFQFVLTEEFKEILNILKNSNESIFITGKAGTGKSSLLKHFIKETNKKYVILAPTGIAALNVSGQTIHSFFRFPPKIFTPNNFEPDYVRAEMFRQLEMVIIDEISMVRADLMDGIDIALRKNRNRLNESFGGVQMVFIGDLFQLPPVLTGKERDVILERYEGQYFFDAPVFKDFTYHFKELTKVFRQAEEEIEFKILLDNIRINNVNFDDMALLNSRHKDNAGERENSIFLTTRKNIARNINKEKLDLIDGKEHIYLGQLTGKYVDLKNQSEEDLENKLPAPYKLKLKKGAQIMMLKNDSGKRWVNGTIGKIDKIKEELIVVNINGIKHSVEKESWNEVEYVLNREKDVFEEKIIAGFTQYPLRLSYAMTIHKSQGKTFENITVDVGTGAFAHGQIYVALSRCISLKGIILNNPIRNNDIIVDPRVVEYYKIKSIPSKAKLTAYRSARNDVRKTVLLAIEKNKKVRIDYEKYDGELSTRNLSNLQISNEFGEFGYNNDHIKAFCHLRNEERVFKIDRIIKIEIIE